MPRGARSRCAARSRRRPVARKPSAARVRGAALRLVLVVLLRPERHGAAGPRQPRRDREHAPGLKYIQIDDGYQPAMGDWLETGAAFGGQVQTVLRQIRDRGFEPAIWVAPFIAEGRVEPVQAASRLVREGRCEGKPLRARIAVTFGGWRRGPW